MKQREALSGVADALLEKLHQLRDLDASRADGAKLAELGTKDHERVMLAWEELEYRLTRIVDPKVRRKAAPIRQDPNQIQLFG